MAKSSASQRLQISAHTPLDADGKDELMEVSFRPAKGGMISETRHRKKGKEMYDSHSETAVHPSVAHAVKHLKKVFGGKEEDDD